jgi:hypothetical protein
LDAENVFFCPNLSYKLDEFGGTLPRVFPQVLERNMLACEEAVNRFDEADRGWLEDLVVEASTVV